MNEYDTVISELLGQEPADQDGSNYYLSAYFPAQDFTPERLAREVKSGLLTTMRDHPDIDRMSQLHTLITEHAENRVKELDYLRNGVGLFYQFNAEKLEHGNPKDVLPEKTTVVPMLFTPQKDVYIGKTYDLDYLVWNNNRAADALILNLSNEQCDFFHFLDHELNKVGQADNQYLHFDEDEYLEKHSPTREDSTYYGTGADNIQDHKEKQTRLFLNDLDELVNGSERLKRRTDYLVIFYSTVYAPIIDNFVDKLSTDLGNAIPILIMVNENFREKDLLKKKTGKEIRDFQSNVRQDMLEMAQEDYHHYTEGWEPVADAVRKAQIETLFLSARASKPGYVDDNFLPYLQSGQTEKSARRQVRDTSPWIQKQAVETDARTVIFPDHTDEDLPEIAAHLRYKPG